MKQCKQCGREWPDNANFCSNCGTWLTGGNSATAGNSTVKGTEEKFVEGGLTTMEGVNNEQTQTSGLQGAWPDAPAQSAPAETVAAPPASGEEKPKKQKVWKRTKTGEIRMGFFRWLFLMILSLILLVVLCAPAAVYIVRDSSSVDGMKQVIDFVRPSSIRASDLVIGGSASQRFFDWLGDAIYRSFGGQIDLTGRELQTAFEASNLRSYLAEKGSAFFNEIYSGNAGPGATRAEFAAKLKENAEVFRTELGIDMNDTVSDQVAGWFESAGFFNLASAQALNNESPTAFLCLRYGLDWYAMIAYGVVALLLIIWMTVVGKSFLRTVKCVSVVAILIGLVLCLGGLAAYYVPAVWEMAFMGNYLISALVGGMLYTHLLIPSACILGGGILLRLLVALIRSAKINKRIRAAQF